MVRDGTRTRLRSWKEIAAFFGADERTVKRWETTRSLPVHRTPGVARGAVFAYSDELAAWLERDTPRPAPAPEAQPPVETPPSRRRPRWVLAGGVAIAIAVAGAVGVTALRPPVAARAGTPSQLYLSGVYHLGTRTKAGLELAERQFAGAIARDPDDAAAYARLAETYAMMAQYLDVPADDAYARAEEAARRAEALDPRSGRAQAMLGYVAFHARHDLDEAERRMARAVALEPDTADIRLWYAMIAIHRGGDQRVALAQIARAQSLDPGSRAILANRALILFHAGRAEEAIPLLRDLEAAEPTLRSPPEYLGTIYLAQGRWGEALREMRAAAGIAGDAGRAALVGQAEAALGAGGPAAMFRALYAGQRAGHAAGTVPAFKLAQTAMLLGDRRAALGWLAAAAKAREPDLVGIRLEPALRPLRGDARFEALARATGV